MAEPFGITSSESILDSSNDEEMTAENTITIKHRSEIGKIFIASNCSLQTVFNCKINDFFYY